MSSLHCLAGAFCHGRAVEAAIMLNSLYLALWITNFITVVSRQFPHAPEMQLLM